VEIDTTILASSAWRFLTIGNFRSNEETTTKAHQYCPWAYYYIDDVSVELSENQTKIPNVFTPNGDGVNDTFRPYLFEPDDVNARVYDRWGRLMYKSNDQFFEWNGENQSGTEAAAGVYFWTINYSNQMGLSYNLRGYVTLIR
jgi:gliding motility-associated-like protein